MGQTFVRYWDAKYGYDYNWYKWAERNSLKYIPMNLKKKIKLLKKFSIHKLI